MCGRFTLRAPLSVLIEQFRLRAASAWSPRFNIAPTQPVPVVRASGPDGSRTMTLLQWGLVPSWARDAKAGARVINARGETVAEKPAFRASFRHRRCLILADGYYEWQRIGTRKQAHYFRLRDCRPFAFAGLWDVWRPGTESPLESCVIITTAANELGGAIHDRMPVILDDEDYGQWLDPRFEERRTLERLLRPLDAARMVVERVGGYVNSVRHDDARCLEGPREF